MRRIVHIPVCWQTICQALSGTVLVIGSSDSGKSTLVRYLVEQLGQRYQRVGWLDGDVGQSSLGVPTTMNLALMDEGEFVEGKPQSSFFVGATSPRGNMLPLLVGLQRLKQLAFEKGAGILVVDTTGLVAEEAGGGALKQWKIELLQPQTVIALQHGREMEHLLAPLRYERRFELQVLPPVSQVRTRSPEQRSRRRRVQFRRYFGRSQILSVPKGSWPVYGLKPAAPGRLMAFLDKEGFALGLGVLVARSSSALEILTPLKSFSAVAGLRFGSIMLDPPTGEERFERF